LVAAAVVVIVNRAGIRCLAVVAVVAATPPLATASTSVAIRIGAVVAAEAAATPPPVLAEPQFVVVRAGPVLPPAPTPRLGRYPQAAVAPAAAGIVEPVRAAN
jgi:hypothetical protein